MLATISIQHDFEGGFVEADLDRHAKEKILGQHGVEHSKQRVDGHVWMFNLVDVYQIQKNIKTNEQGKSLPGLPH